MIVSPFIYQPYKIEKTNVKVKYSELLERFSGGDIKEAHTNCLRLILKYRVLTRSFMERAENTTEYKCGDGSIITIKSALSFLVDGGLIHRTYLKRIDHDDIEVYNNQLDMKRSTNFYYLTESGYIYANHVLKNVIADRYDYEVYTKNLDDPAVVLKELSTNQFLIYHGLHFSKHVEYHGVKADAVVHEFENKNKEIKYKSFYVFSARNTGPEWIEELYNRMKSLLGSDQYGLLVITENNQMITEFYEKYRGELRNVFYTNDTCVYRDQFRVFVKKVTVENENVYKLHDIASPFYSGAE
jgi:hypothetical protein